MTKRKASHSEDGIDRLFVSRKEGGRELATIEDSVDASIQGIDECLKRAKKHLL